MELSSLANLATSMAQSRTDQDIGIAVLKKALDAESSTAATLLNTIQAPTAANLPSHLRQNINTTA